MSTICEPLQGGCVLDILKQDLTSLACRAAVELDGLRLGRSSSLGAVAELLSCLEESIVNVSDASSPSSLLNPTTAVVVNAAIGDVSEEKRSTCVDGLVRQAGQFTEQLRKLLETPDTFRDESLGQLAEMQNFCLALSKRAFGLKPSRNNVGYQHPYRR